MAKSTATDPAGYEEMIFVGCDDGHDSIKLEIRAVNISNGQIMSQERSHLTIPSKVVRGRRVLSLGSDEEGGAGIYNVPTADGSGTESFTVTDSLPADLIDTRTLIYPTSSVNRVLVHDALVRANLGGKDVRIVTGLPVTDYYISGSTNTNTELIEKKKENLLIGKISPLSQRVQLARIQQHNVACEGLAAVYDLAIKDDGEDDPAFFQLLEQGPVGIIDIGGKTTDVAVAYLERGKHQVDRTRTSSIEYGMLRLMGDIKAELQNKLGLDNIPPRAMAKVLTDRKLMISGEFVDVHEHVETVVAKAFPDLAERIKAVWGGAYDLSKVIVVGGGSHLLYQSIKDGLYRHTETRREPEYANARGMLKLGMRAYLAQQQQQRPAVAKSA